MAAIETHFRLSTDTFKACHLVPHLKTPRVCGLCGAETSHHRVDVCSDACRRQWLADHDWSFARPAAIKRDGTTCPTCGDHLSARYSSRDRRNMVRGRGCHNHRDRIETFCRTCEKARPTGDNENLTPRPACLGG
ncbi:Uncharacterised protein [Mycobacteroides abscessus subsp. abscessus]|nr:Uncharacterised protein [Mycobacteroides abscessus subsp. abscessus]SHQ51116.1 Uncharacterised protein [Mycobacteroides abscessus subsp. abscessus]SLL30765.1 Uncharacterised protein [Mycobacteroides abscessus subsp. abscessus]